MSDRDNAEEAPFQTRDYQWHEEPDSSVVAIAEPDTFYDDGVIFFLHHSHVCNVTKP